MHISAFIVASALFATSVVAQMYPLWMYSCVNRGQVTCDRKIWPKNSFEGECVGANKFEWYERYAKMRSRCYCDRKDLQEKWWDCYYMEAAACPSTPDTIKWLRYQEWEYHRYMRRLYCLDDYKPNPPWHKIDNDYLKSHYDTNAAVQYIDDYH